MFNSSSSLSSYSSRGSTSSAVAEITVLPAEEEESHKDEEPREEIVPFSGEDNAVRAFQSLLSFDLEGDNAPPPSTPPFIADILIQIFLFLPVAKPKDSVRGLFLRSEETEHREEEEEERVEADEDAKSEEDVTFTWGSALAVSQVCRMWRYYANYLPHWSEVVAHSHIPYGAKTRLPQFFTRDELVKACDDAFWEEEHVKDVNWRWTFAYFLFALFALSANYAVGWALGWTSTALYSDITVGIATFFAILGCVVIEILITGESAADDDINTSRKLNFFTPMVCLSAVFGIVLALIGKRVLTLDDLIDGGERSLPWSVSSCEQLRNRSLQPLPTLVKLPFAMNSGLWVKENLTLFDRNMSSSSNMALIVNNTAVSKFARWDFPSNDVTFFRFQVEPDASVPLFNVANPYSCVALGGGLPIPAFVAFRGRNVTFSSSAATSLHYRVAIPNFWYDSNDGSSMEWHTSHPAWTEHGIYLLNPKLTHTIGFLENKQSSLYTAVIIVVVCSFVVLLVMLALNLSTKDTDTLDRITNYVQAACLIICSPVTLLVCGVICVLGDAKPDLFMCDTGGGIVMLVVGGILCVVLLQVIFDDD